MRRKEQYADEIIKMLERTKGGAWASNINLNTKDRVIEVCQNCVDSWSGRKFKDHCTTPPQALEREPCEDCEDAVNRGLYEQTRWERDIAVKQLSDLGYQLGEKVRKCEDAISRQAVKQEFAEWHKGGYEDCAFYKYLDKMPPVSVAEKTGRWIPVSERLPEKPDNYPRCGIYRTYFLVTLESGCVKSLGYEFDSDRWQITGSPVIAWLPLPKPYRGESEESDADR